MKTLKRKESWELYRSNTDSTPLPRVVMPKNYKYSCDECEFNTEYECGCRGLANICNDFYFNPTKWKWEEET